MKSISKYFILSFTSRNGLTNFQQLSPRSAEVHLVQKGIRAVLYPVRLEVHLRREALAAQL